MTPRIRDVEGHRIKQVDLVVENFQLLGPAPTGEIEAYRDPGAGQPAPAFSTFFVEEFHMNHCYYNSPNPLWTLGSEQAGL